MNNDKEQKHSQQTFIVKVKGEMEYPEDDPVFGTYTKIKIISLIEAVSIREAVNAVIDAENENNWRIRDPEKDYYDDELGRDMGPISFTPNTIEILDRDGDRVLSGDFKSGLKWTNPATEEEMLEISKEISTLRREAYHQGLIDNHGTGRDLYAKADRLNCRLISSKYREHAEVLEVLQRQNDELDEEYQYRPRP